MMGWRSIIPKLRSQCDFGGCFRELQSRLSGHFGATLLRTFRAGSGAGILFSDQRERMYGPSIRPRFGRGANDIRESGEGMVVCLRKNMERVLFVVVLMCS